MQMGDSNILSFIKEFKTSEEIRNHFAAGYCWHFAHILKATFGRGEVCIKFPYGHFVWVDTNEVAYDIDGVAELEDAKAFIPESFLGNCLEDFKHIPGQIHNTSMSELEDIWQRYLANCK